jgi:hypothetical protein
MVTHTTVGSYLYKHGCATLQQPVNAAGLAVHSSYMGGSLHVSYIVDIPIDTLKCLAYRSKALQLKKKRT